MKSFSAVFLLLLGFTSAASASVTLVFTQPFIGGIASNFANAAGIATDNMRWGIVVDTTGNGFASTGSNYDSYAGGVTTAGFFGVGGAATDDYFIAGGLTVDSTANLESGSSTPGGHGTIYNTSAIAVSANAGGGVVNSGEKFALVWFSTNTSGAGDKYGFFTDASFVLPSDGSTGNFDSVFLGNDPIRSATNTFAVAGVPEPSRMLLAGFGVLGLMMRRRRSV